MDVTRRRRCAELLEGVDGVLIFNVKSIQMKISELIFGEL